MLAPTVHHFDPESGVYRGSSVLDASDLDPEETRRAGEPVYQRPAHTTLIAPPEAQEGYDRCFADGAWTQVASHAGKTIYETATKRTKVLPDDYVGAVPEGWTLDAPGPFDAWDAAGGAWAEDAALRAALLPAEITAERDRRISAGFTFNGTRFQTRPDDRENIAGAGILAAIAVMNGAQPGDLRWADPDRDFAWIAEDNSLVPMDAPTVIAFGKAIADHKKDHVFAARDLKDMDPMPSDFADDSYWPSPGA